MRSDEIQEQLNAIPDTSVREKFQAYPPNVLPSMLTLRAMILETAIALHRPDSVRETLKWGEPSYHLKGGSPIRIDWKPKSLKEYQMYFSCQSKLVPTFKRLFGNRIKFEKNRAIVFTLGEDFPLSEVEACISLAFRYHRIKHLPLLGVQP